ncbi:hypothetical protein LCGC14_2731600 [marine sediment metagenome]|uniref:Uncharacterized protein n=1 Tax=marine sediment metagenome TaxID=412755 RepID=A0A0F8Z773_9ZZZZ
MKCICGSGANEEIEDLKSKFILALKGRSWRNRALERYRREVEGLTADCQALQDRVMAVKGLWSVSIKNNTGLKAQITWLEDVLREIVEINQRVFCATGAVTPSQQKVWDLARKSFSPSSHPSPEAKSQRDHGPDLAPSGQTAPGCPKCR